MKIAAGALHTFCIDSLQHIGYLSSPTDLSNSICEEQIEHLHETKLAVIREIDNDIHRETIKLNYSKDICIQKLYKMHNKAIYNTIMKLRAVDDDDDDDHMLNVVELTSQHALAQSYSSTHSMQDTSHSMQGISSHSSSHSSSQPLMLTTMSHEIRRIEELDDDNNDDDA